MAYKTFGRSHSPRLRGIDYAHLMFPVHVIAGTWRRAPIFSCSDGGGEGDARCETGRYKIGRYGEGDSRYEIGRYEIGRCRCAEIVAEEIGKEKERLNAWCVMPDHVHLLFDPQGVELNLPVIMKSIKGRSAARIRKAAGIPRVWQESSYDHILGKDEASEVVALYILNNPVRKGLAEDWRMYPYSWSRFHPR